MSAATDTACPGTPWPQDTSRDELRAELQQALQALNTAGQQIDELNALLEAMAKDLASIMVPHLHCDGAGVYAALAAIAAKRVKRVISTAAGQGRLQ